MLRKAAGSLARGAFLRAGSAAQNELQRLVDPLIAALAAEVLGFSRGAMRFQHAALERVAR